MNPIYRRAIRPLVLIVLAVPCLAFQEAFDQGISIKRSVLAPNPYGNYVRAVGDPNNNHRRDPGEAGFGRRKAVHGLSRSLGSATITVVSVNGDTEGRQHDIELDPATGGLQTARTVD